MAIVLKGGQAINTMSLDAKNTSITVNTAADSSDWWTTPLHWGGTGGDPWHPILWRSLAYDDLYTEQLWVNTAVDKLVKFAITPQITIFREKPRGRTVANDTDYGRLIRHPNRRHAPINWWSWMWTMFWVHGMAVAWKERDRSGKPTQLHGLHPTRLRYGGPWNGWTYGWEEMGLTGDPKADRWWWRRNNGEEIPLNREDLVVFHTVHPKNQEIGLSKLEPLRATLENEAAARKANEAMWLNGGKPSFVLKHPGKFSNYAKSVQVLADQFKRKHGGVENWGAPLVLEEGMEALPLAVQNDLQYIATRELNREEILSAYDVPPVAVGILDNAGNNNVVELHRSIYRDTMPPAFRIWESTLDHDLRDGTFGADRPADFSGQLEALWDLVPFLKATPEEKTKSDAQAIQTGQKTIAEVRESNNDPFIEGTDTLLVNAAITPLERAIGIDDGTIDPFLVANLIVRLGGVGVVVTVEEARKLLKLAGMDGLAARMPTPPPGPPGTTEGAPPINSGIDPDGDTSSQTPGLSTLPGTQDNARPAQQSGQTNTRALWGRLGRLEALEDIDMAELAYLAPDDLRAKVLGGYILVRDDEGSVGDLRNLLKSLGV